MTIFHFRGSIVLMSGEGSFLVLGLDGTVISSGGDLQGDERFVLLLFKVLGIFFHGLTLYCLYVCYYCPLSGVQQQSSNWSRQQARETLRLRGSRSTTPTTHTSSALQRRGFML